MFGQRVEGNPSRGCNALRCLPDEPGVHHQTHALHVRPGSHTLVATPFSGADGSGLGGVPLFLHLQTENHWARTGSLNKGRMNHRAVLLSGGKVLMGPYSAATTELYDSVTGRWSYTGSAKHVRTNYTATLLQNGKVLVAGGGTNHGKPTETELYDPDTGTWTVSGSLAHAREHHTATLLKDGRVLVVGGYFDDGAYASVEVGI
jgi:galactose oxidase-like protein